MDLTGDARLPAPPERVFAEVADLAGYPAWLSIVRAAVPDPPRPDDPGPAWLVELGARVGPFTRTKRVRMVRVEHRPPEHARFERREGDGRPHGAWVLDAALAPAADGGTALRMHLHYGGGAWLPGLDLVLGQEVRRAGRRLAGRLADADEPQ